MGRFICLHGIDNDKNKEIWIDANAIIAVMDMRPRHDWTLIDAYNSIGYCVDETAESVIGLIKQQTNPLDNYVCLVPASWSLSKEEEQ